MTVGIYGIFDDRDDTCLYVGLSRSIELRWRSHLNALRRGDHKRSGFNSFFESINRDENLLRFQILEECENDDRTLNRFEIKWFNALTPSFSGKVPSLNETWAQSEETKAKISAAAKVAQVYEFVCKNCKNTFTSNRNNRINCSKACCQASTRKILVGDGFRDDLIYMYQVQELTLKEIALKLSVSHVAVYKFMEKLDIPRRGRSNAGIHIEIESDPRLEIFEIRSRGAKLSAHNRWHVARDIVKDDCALCISKLDEV